jgi:hypothetical protein
MKKKVEKKQENLTNEEMFKIRGGDGPDPQPVDWPEDDD